MAAPIDQTFRHCPRCGAGGFGACGPNSMRCESCELMWYRNVASAVDVIIRDRRGAILVTTRAREPGLGKLDFPGGFVDDGETLEQAARREVAEETGLDVGALRYFGSFSNSYAFGGIIYPTLDVIFCAELSSEQPAQLANPRDDVDSASFRDIGELTPHDFGLESTRRAFVAYRDSQTGVVQ